MKHQRGGRGISVLFLLTLALEVVELLIPHLSCFTPGKENLYPIYRRLGGPWDWSGHVGKNSRPLGFKPRTIQPIAFRCTNYTTSVTVAL